MDATGIEPMTSSLQGKRATNCATCPNNYVGYVKEKVRKTFLTNLGLSLLIYIIKAWFHLPSEV